MECGDVRTTMEHRLADGDLVVAVPASSSGGGPTQSSPHTVVTVVPLGTQDAAFAGAEWAWHANTGYVMAGSSGGGGSAAYNEEYERQQVNAAAAAGQKPVGGGKQVKAAKGGADDDAFDDVEMGDDLLPM